MNIQKYIERFRGYHFEFKHLTVLFFVLLLFQLIVSLINKSSITTFLNDTRDWYQKDAVEMITNLTATSLELTIESSDDVSKISNEKKARIIQSFNIIFSQQFLQHNIEELCILISRKDTTYRIDEGDKLFSYLKEGRIYQENNNAFHSTSIEMYENLKEKLRSEEQIISITDSVNTFHVFVPFVIRGEYVGAVYMKSTPDFSELSDELFAKQDEITIIYISLILLGFISMYFISSYTVRERDETQRRLFLEHEENLKKQIIYEKELTFTKRIYHTNHKAEKVMGFIKEDLKKLNEENIEDVKFRITKYSNFISRVIYDMKWFDPPIQTVRGQMYKTNLNKVLNFIVDNIFLRVSKVSENYNFKFELDDKLPEVQVNEFVIWELLEPLIQNAVEHTGNGSLTILIKTIYNEQDNSSCIKIIDNGKGIEESLLEKNSDGVEKIFLENVTTKTSSVRDGGYGCYIAYQIARRCGWQLSVKNNSDRGSTFIIKLINE